MNRLMSSAAVAALALTVLGSVAARAGDHTAPADVPLPIEGVVQILTFQGYQDLRSIRFDDGAYRVRAQDPNGTPVVLDVDPATGEAVVRADKPRNKKDQRVEAIRPVPPEPRVAALDFGRDLPSRAPHPNMGVGSVHASSAKPVSLSGEPLWPTGRF